MDCDKCVNCTKEIEIDTNIFSCNHYVCSICIYKNVMDSCSSILVDNLSYENIELKCLLCKTGVFKSSLKNISEILEKYKDHKEENKENVKFIIK